MAISALIFPCVLLVIGAKSAATTRNSSTQLPGPLFNVNVPKNVSQIQIIPGTVLNPYCNLSSYEIHHDFRSDFHSARMQCANHEASPLEDNYDSDFYPVNYMQADNGSMSRALEGALEKVTVISPNKTSLWVDISVDGYHPLSSTKRYSGIVAVIDVSSKLTAHLGPTDKLRINMRNAGVRFDPEHKADKRFKLLAAKDVVLLAWDYLVGAPSI